MKLHPRVTRALVDLVIRFETFLAEAEPAPGGGFSVGYGHTTSARAGVRIGRRDAELLLRYDLAQAADTVEAALYAPVSQRQFEALTAFCFNVGAKNFRRSSALARINAGAELEAADEIERWRRAELGAGAQVVDALVRRRAAEKAHYLGLPEGFAKSPSARLRPLATDGGEVAASSAAVDLDEPEPIEAVADESAGEDRVGTFARPSAALDAAAGVQARLRRLFPDVEPAFPPAEPSSDPLPVPPHAADATAWAEDPPPFAAPDEPATMGPTRSDLAPAAVDARIAAPPGELPAETPVSPPPFAIVPPPPPPPTTTSAPDVRPPSSSGIASHAGSPADDRGSAASTRRWLDLALVALGAVLFAGALGMIVAGQPNGANLGAGVFGALLAALGAYRLLGTATAPSTAAPPPPGGDPFS